MLCRMLLPFGGCLIQAVLQWSGKGLPAVGHQRINRLACLSVQHRDVKVPHRPGGKVAIGLERKWQTLDQSHRDASLLEAGS